MTKQRPDAFSSPDPDPDRRADAEPEAMQQEQQPSRDVATCEAELEETRDRLLRTQAELENFRRRAQRELQDTRRFATQPLLTDLLPVLDNMERAIDAAEQAPGGSGLLEGFRMVHQLLLTVLEKHDCLPIEADGVAFDPALHEAMMQEPSPAAKGTVTRVLQRGYRLHDRVIRPAQVFVSTGPATSD